MSQRFGSYIFNKFCVALFALAPMLATPLVLAQPGEDNGKAAVKPAVPAYNKIHVPIEDLDAVFNRDKRGVLLPVADYEKLLTEAEKNRKKNSGQPREILVRQIDYQASLAGERMVLKTKIQLRKLAPGWQQLVLPTRGLSVEKATIGETSAPLARPANSAEQLVLFTDKVGDFQLDLVFSTPAAVVGSDLIAAFGLVPSTSATLNISLPEGKRLYANGVLQESDGDANSFNVHVGGMKELRLQVTDKKQQQSRDALVFATTNIQANVTAGEIIWQADTTAQVFGQAVDQLTFQIPNQLEITNVTSIGLEAWELADDETEGFTTITLKYRQSFFDGKQVRFEGVASHADDDSWTVPNLVFKNVTSHLGRILIHLADGLRLQASETDGVRPAALQSRPKAPAGFQAGRVFAYDFWDQEFRLGFISQEKEREVHVAVTTAMTLGASAPELQSVMTVKTLFAPLFEYKIQLPSDWDVTSIQVNNAVATFEKVDAEVGTSEYRIPLNPTVRPGMSVNITMSARLVSDEFPIETDPVTITFPNIGLPDAAVVEGTFGIVGGSEFEVIPQDIDGLDPAHLKLDGERLGYRYQEADYSGTIEVTRKSAHLSVQTVAITRVDPTTLFSHLETKLLIEGGSQREFQIGLSTSAGNNVRFRIPGNVATIVEQTMGEMNNGYQIWNVRLDRRVSGHLMLLADVWVNRDGEKKLKPPRIFVPDADRQDGYIALEADTDQKLNTTAVDGSGRPLAEVDPVDFPPILYRPQKRLVAAWQYFLPNYDVSINEIRYDPAAIPSAIGYRSEMKSILSKTGNFQHEAIWNFSSVGVQSLSLRLPENSELWGVLLDGNPVVVRKTDNGYSVPIPGDQSDTATHKLAIYYDTVSSQNGSIRRIRQVPPQLMVISGRGVEQPLEILEQDWVVYYPHQSAVTQSAGLFEPTGDFDNPSFLAELPNALSLEFNADFIWQIVAIIVIGFVLAIITRLFMMSPQWLRYTSAGIVGCIVLFAGFGLLILAGGLGGASAPTSMSAGSDMAYLEESEAATEEAWEQAIKAEESAHMAYSKAREMRTQEFGKDFDEVPQMDASTKMPESRPQRNFEVPPSVVTANPQMTNQPAKPTAPFGQNAREEVARKKSDQTRGFNKDNQNIVGGFGAGGGIQGNQSGFGGNTNGTNVFTDPFANDSKSVTGIPTDGKPQEGEEKSDSRRLEDLTKSRSKFQTGGDEENRGRDRSESLDMVDQGLAMQQEFAQNQNGKSIDLAETPPQIPEFAQEGKGGLLSLNIGVEVPEESESQFFRYAGNRGAEELELQFTMVDRRMFTSMRWLLIAIVVLLCWFGRKLPSMTRLAIATAGIAVPLALAPFAPAMIMVLLDAVLMGTILSIFVWCCDGCFGWCSQGWSCLTKPLGWCSTKQAASVIIIAGLLSAFAGDANAQKGSQPQQASSKAMPTITPVPPVVIGPQLPTVIVPYEKGTNPLQAKRVLLPHEEFMKLWREANPDKVAAKTQPGMQAFINEAVYSASLVESGKQTHVEIAGRLVITNLDENTVSLQLPVKNVALESATLDGEDAVISSEKNGLKLILEKKGTFVCDLKFRVSVSKTGDAGQFALALDPVASGMLSFELPGDDLNIRVNQASNTYQVRSEGKKKFAEIPVSQGGTIQVGWEPKLKTNGGLSFVNAEGFNIISLDDRGLQLEIGHSLKVRQGVITEVRYSLPESVRLQSISGPDVGGWQLEGNELKVLLRRKVDDESTVVLRAYMAVTISSEDSEIAVPVIAPNSIDREAATLVVTSSDNLNVRTASTSGLRQINITKINLLTGMSPMKYAPQYMYRTTGKDVELTLVVQRRATDLQGTVYHGIVIGQRKIQMASRAEFLITDAPRASISFYLPQDYKPLSIQAPHLSDWYIGDDGSSIIVEFEEPITGRIPIALEGVVPKAPDDDFAAIDTPFPRNIERLTTFAAIWNDGSFSASLDEFTGWRTVPPNSLPAALRQLRPDEPKFAFRSTALEPDLITMTLAKSEPKLSGESVELIAISDTSIDYGITLRWNIDQAPTDQLQFSLPSWISDRVEFTGEQIRRISKSGGEDNRTNWTVELLRPARGQYLLSAIATLPPPEKGELAAARIQLEQSAEDDSRTALTTQQHYVLLVNLSRGQTTLVNPQLGERVSLRDLPLKVPQELAVQATDVVKFNSKTEELQWSVKHFEQQSGAAAAVNLAELVVVIRQDGSWRLKSSYTVKNRNRQFLALRLPEDSRLLSVMVAGQPSRAVNSKWKSQPISLIAMPKTSAADTSFQIEAVISGRLPKQLPGWFQIAPRTVSIPMPHVIDKSESEEIGIPVLNTRVSVYLPNSVKPVILTGGSSTNMIPETEYGETLARQRSILKDVRDLNRVLIDKTSSFAQRTQARDNLKRLNIALKNYHDSNSQSGINLRDKPDEEVIEETIQLQTETEKALEATRENFNTYEIDAQKQAEQPTAQFDNGRRYIQGNNDFIISNNGTVLFDDVNGDGQQADNLFSFQVPNVTKGKESAAGKSEWKDQTGSGRRMLQQQVEQQNTALNYRLGQAKQQSRSGGQPMSGYVVIDETTANTISGMGIPQQFRPNASGIHRGLHVENDMDGDGTPRQQITPKYGVAVLDGSGHTLPRGESVEYQSSTGGWTTSGGLSLPIDVPTDGQQLAFTKTGGNPVLTFQLYSENTIRSGISVVWLLGWAFAAAVLVGVCCRNSLGKSCCQRWGVTMLVLGITLFLLTPGGYAAIGLILFCIGVVCIAATCCYRKVETTQLQQA